MKTTRRLYVFAGIFGLCGLLAATWYGPRLGAGAGRDPLERAVLAENWAEVQTLCGGEGTAQPAAHLRALKAHAGLALNHNDESLALFLSIANKEDLSAWRDWASKFAEDYPRSAVALYLKGDALARFGNWAAAADAYTQALGCVKTPLAEAMVLNARGVARVYCAKVKEALGDLEKACAAVPDFADAHASLGTLLMLTEAAEGAKQHYDAAVKGANNSFALAKNGRGCATLGYSTAERDITAALTDFAAASACPSVKPLAESNIKSLVKFVQGPTAEDDEKKSGMTLHTSMLHEPATIQRDQLNRMSNAGILRAYHDAERNALHSERSGGVTGWINGQAATVGIDMSRVSENSFADARGWRNLQSEAFGIARSRGLDPLSAGTGSSPGGADSGGGAQDKSKGDMGQWLATNTRFGLAPHTSLPR